MIQPHIYHNIFNRLLPYTFITCILNNRVSWHIPINKCPLTFMTSDDYVCTWHIQQPQTINTELENAVKQPYFNNNMYKTDKSALLSDLKTNFLLRTNNSLQNIPSKIFGIYNIGSYAYTIKYSHNIPTWRKKMFYLRWKFGSL